MKCSNCGSECPENAKFCRECGNEVVFKTEALNENLCKACGNVLIDGALFCNNCGTKREEIELRSDTYGSCTTCGKKLEAKATFCGACGTAFKNSNINEGTKRKSKESHGITKLLVLLISVTLICAGVIVWTFYQDKVDKTDQTTVQNKVTDEISKTTKDDENGFNVPNESQTDDSNTLTNVEKPQDKTENTVINKTKESFKAEALTIENYSKNNLETAESQFDMNTESYTVYEKWDKLLNKIYQHLKATMPSGEFERLKNDEIRWINEKEAAIEKARKEWEGGSGEPLAKNSVGISFTKDRCYYLISLIQ